MKRVLFLVISLCLYVFLDAQVTIGSNIEPTKAALLEMKTQQANADNVTSTAGGFLLPRVKLVDPTTMEPFIERLDVEWVDATKRDSLSRVLKGLLVFNVGTTNGLQEGILIWTGAIWDKVSTAHPWVNPVSTTSTRTVHATHEDDVIAATAAVTIGAAIIPLEASLLQLTDIPNAPGDSANATKGLALPRVQLSAKDELYPMFLTHPHRAYHATNNPPKAHYTANKAALKKSHVGLMVFNTTATDDGLCVGLNQWNGEEWNCFQTRMGNAKFADVSCNDIVVNGTYIEGMEINTNHYLTINVNVTRIGSYTISVRSKRNATGTPSNGNNNGYNYYLTGVALETGPMTLILPCQGKPLVVSEETSANVYNSDDLVVEGLTMTGATNNVCPRKVRVMTHVATYALSCQSIVVNGQYRKGAALTSANTITMTAQVTSTGSYSFSTPMVQGIRFTANGNFTSTGTQTVTLMGTGTPTQHTNHTVTINANTPEGNNQCTATIPITLPRMTYMLIGYDEATFHYSFAGNSPRRSAFNGASFGPSDNAKVRIVSLDLFGSYTSADAAVTALNGNTKPDIVLYFAYGTLPNPSLATALRNYVNRGGALIYGAADDTSGGVNTLLTGIFPGFGNHAVNRRGNPAIPVSNQEVFQIANLPDDPIINGPFGRLGGMFWGEDNEGTVYLDALPAGSVQVCSMNNQHHNASKSLNHSTVWYNSAKNFVYFGDCGCSTNANIGTSPNLNYWCPSYYSGGLPQSKPFGRWNSGDLATVSVVNAMLEMNAVAWALREAAVSGINPH